jgi:DNA-directed RNA polymerase specialized sigma24 family protein
MFETLRDAQPGLFKSGCRAAVVSEGMCLPLREDVLFALSQLHEPARSILLFRTVCGLSPEDIANKLALPPNVVASALRISRNQLVASASSC